MTDTQLKPYRRGVCPGAGSAMESGDGLLSRVRIPGGRLKSSQLAVLAALAERWAQPMLELTSRGNVQIRGLDDQGDAQATAALIHHKLAVAPASAEAVRNVLSTPAADLDATALADPWPIAHALDQAFIADTELWALPNKFRIVVDGGGATGLANKPADIRADAVATAEGLRYRLALAGTACSAQALGNCHPEHAATALLALARCFAKLNGRLQQPARGLAEILPRTGIAPFQNACGTLERASVLTRQPHSAILGAQPGWFGSAVPFGRLTVDAAFNLANLAEQKGNGELRLTPWRQVLLPDASPDVASTLQALGLITSYGDSRLSLTACPGAPACLSGSTATRDDALAWASALPQLFDGELAVHVSGCGKGCARPQASPLTLTARNGRYDLILNDRADPLHEENRVLSGLAPGEVIPALRRLADSVNQQRRSGEPLKQVVERLDKTLVWTSSLTSSAN